MWWGYAPIIIAICSIIISIYIFKVKENNKFFWSSIALSGINLLGGWFAMIYINFKIGLILLIIPFIFILKGYYNHTKAKKT